jgi:hypothetical protein
MTTIHLTILRIMALSIITLSSMIINIMLKALSITEISKTILSIPSISKTTLGITVISIITLGIKVRYILQSVALGPTMINGIEMSWIMLIVVAPFEMQFYAELGFQNLSQHCRFAADSATIGINQIEEKEYLFKKMVLSTSSLSFSSSCLDSPVSPKQLGN